MQRFSYLIALLIGIFAIQGTESVTHPQDGITGMEGIVWELRGPLDVVERLADVINLVESSQIQLRGWSGSLDPCGETVPCGINRFAECNWEGLACAVEDGSVNRVVGIAIDGYPGHQLHGSLPGILPTKLESISLTGHTIYGGLMNLACSGAEYECSDIWWMNRKLKRIYLQNNDLEGPLPRWPTLTDLERVRLSDNRLNGSLPSEWSQKLHLYSIDLSRNALDGSLPDQWSSLHALHFIRLAENELRSEIPQSWLQLLSPILLDLSGNCGICGPVPDYNDDHMAILGNGTNLNIACERCRGCRCRRGDLKFVLTNVLLSITVLAVLLFFWVLYRCLRTPDRPEPQLPGQTPLFLESVRIKPTENPTIVINPDQDVCICCQIDETVRHGMQTEGSSISSSSENISDGDDISDYSVSSDSESIDPRVLAFLYKTSPMLAVADRSWSEEIKGTTERRQEGCVSDADATSNTSSLRLRRSKSALGGFSQKKVSRDFMESRKSAKLLAELAPTPKQPRNKHRRRRVRTFRRRNRRGLAGDFTISEPQASIRIPKEFNNRFVENISTTVKTATTERRTSPPSSPRLRGEPSGSGTTQ